MAIKEITYKDNSFKINYELTNLSCQKDIVFLHGWGSDIKVSKLGFLNTLPDFRHIYIDMPGFGRSTNDTILTTNDYYEIIKLFLTTIKARNDIIVGHSFGGKVATLLKPKLLVLLSSAGIVPKKSLKVRFKIKLFKFLKIFGLGNFYKFFASKDVDKMNQNMYETFKNIVDEVFNEKFQNYDGKTLIFWGKEDSATPLQSGVSIHNLIKSSKFYPLNGDHYFFLDKTNSSFIAKEIDDNY